MGTIFPKEYKDDYQLMRTDFPLEVHTGSKCEAAPYQQSPDHEMRWATIYCKMSALNLDDDSRDKMAIFVNGRDNEGVTAKRKKPDIAGHHNKPYIIRRDLTPQQYRFSDDYYNPETDMIKLESARCPLKHQNEGYLMYLLSVYYRDSSRVLRFENKGELRRGKYAYDKSVAKASVDALKESGHTLSETTEKSLGAALEKMFNNKSQGHKVRGQQGWERDSNLPGGMENCPKREGLAEYTKAMEELLLSENQINSKFTPINLEPQLMSDEELRERFLEHKENHTDDPEEPEHKENYSEETEAQK